MKRFLFRLIGGLICLTFLALIGFRVAAMLRENDALVTVIPDEGRLVVTEFGKIYVEERGPADGPAVLLVHGTAAWSGLWRPTMQALGDAGYRAIAFDMPPFGFSERAEDGDYSRVTQAKRILALRDALEVRPILVAHSFGAAPGVEAVMLDPTPFAGLVVVNGALGVGSHDMEGSLPLPLRPRVLRDAILSITATNPLLTRRLLAGLLYVKETATPEIATLLQRPMTRRGSTAAFGDWLPSLLVPPKDALSTRNGSYAKLSLPVELIWGEQDTVTPPEQGKTLSYLIPQATLTMMPDIGHIPQVESPKAFQDALLIALQRVTNGS